MSVVSSNDEWCQEEFGPDFIPAAPGVLICRPDQFENASTFFRLLAMHGELKLAFLESQIEFARSMALCQVTLLKSDQVPASRGLSEPPQL